MHLFKDLEEFESEARARETDTHFACFTSTNVQNKNNLFQDLEDVESEARARETGTHFTCYTSTKVQIVT